MQAATVPPATVPRRLRADAARNRQRLIAAAAEVFAARGFDATLDDIARFAGVNVATAYRHFANKHELAREFVRQCIDEAAAAAEEAAAVPDPWAGLNQFLERSLEQLASNRAMFDVLTRDYGGEYFAELIRRTMAPLERLLARCREAGVIREDIAATDFAAIIEMLSAITDPRVSGLPYLPHRFIGLILAGLRPPGTAQPGERLPGEPLTEERLIEVATIKARYPRVRPPRHAGEGSAGA
jgi:AcrR family transcriptional regulator